MLNDPQYFQAVFHSLPQVQAMFQAQLDLGMANAELARTSQFSDAYPANLTHTKLRKQPCFAGSVVYFAK